MTFRSVDLSRRCLFRALDFSRRQIIELPSFPADADPPKWACVDLSQTLREVNFGFTYVKFRFTEVDFRADFRFTEVDFQVTEVDFRANFQFTFSSQKLTFGHDVGTRCSSKAR